MREFELLLSKYEAKRSECRALAKAQEESFQEALRLREENQRALFSKVEAWNEVERLRADVNQDIEDLTAENERLRAMEEPLRTLYRFVMESWYARNLAVPSGVLERARQALEEK
jgi:hypothetical protein